MQSIREKNHRNGAASTLCLAAFNIFAFSSSADKLTHFEGLSEAWPLDSTTFASAMGSRLKMDGTGFGEVGGSRSLYVHCVSSVQTLDPTTMATDCPILVWMLSLNREYTEEEYDACYNLVKECVHYITFPHNPPDPNSFSRS
jgi:hypothetical protein